MPSRSEGPGIWLSVWRFLLTHCLYERAAEVLARLGGCAGSPEPSLLALAISTKFAWRGPYIKKTIVIFKLCIISDQAIITHINFNMCVEILCNKVMIQHFRRGRQKLRPLRTQLLYSKTGVSGVYTSSAVYWFLVCLNEFLFWIWFILVCMDICSNRKM